MRYYYNSRKELDVCIIIDFLLTNEIAKLSLKCQGLLMNAVSIEKKRKEALGTRLLHHSLQVFRPTKNATVVAKQSRAHTFLQDLDHSVH